MSLLNAGLLFACALVSLHAAPFVSETFDKPPSAKKWKSDPSVGVKDGALVLVASGGGEGYANSAFVMKAGDAGLGFIAKPVEIELRELDVTGPGVPGDGVMVLILSADTPGEGNSSGYLKLRLGDDGGLLLMCGATGVKEATIHRLATKLTFPLKSLKVRLSAADFTIKGLDASKEFSGTAKWTPEFDPSVWKGAAPYLMIRAVRRPGEGRAEVKVGALTVTPAS